MTLPAMVAVAGSALVLTVAAALFLVVRRRGSGRHRGGQWERGDVLALITLISGCVFGIASLAESIYNAPETEAAEPPAEVGESAEPAPAQDDLPVEGGGPLAVLRAGGDVSLFVDALGDPGFRRPVEMYEGEQLVTSTTRQWGWAREDQYFVRALVDESDQVTGFAVTTLDAETFEPALPYLSAYTDASIVLGRTTFRDVDQWFPGEAPYQQVVSKPLATSGAWSFSESRWVRAPIYKGVTLMHGFVGAGLDESSIPGELFSLAPCGNPSCAVTSSATPLVDAWRGEWPVTTIAMLPASDGVGAEVLSQEPTVEEISAAIRPEPAPGP